MTMVSILMMLLALFGAKHSKKVVQIYVKGSEREYIKIMTSL